jgi:transposase
MILLAEIVDFQRFPHPRELMAYLGLVPSEYSSGETQRRGAITKAGNTHARRVLVEAAWHYRHRPTLGRALAARAQDQPRRAARRPGGRSSVCIVATAISSGTANVRPSR